LSFGGGGTSAQYCRDQRCIVEQKGSVMRGNLIASCSDDGIYLNRAANSRLIHNTLIDTGGISVRFPESTADIEGNLVDGRICQRDGAIIRERDNLDTSITRLLLGSHPVRQLFNADGVSHFSGAAPQRTATTDADTAPDLCGSIADESRAYGAFTNFVDCIRK
jgi:parallel beta-helix repeat protein